MWQYRPVKGPRAPGQGKPLYYASPKESNSKAYSLAVAALAAFPRACQAQAIA